MKFVASYSGGKESALALYRAIEEGHEPIALITTYNTDVGRSHFHGLTEEMLEKIADSLNIPLWLIKTSGEEYAKNFEKILLLAKEKGAKACVFGDIDIEGHIKWCSQRCENVGIIPIFPLLNQNRKDVLYELIDKGFVANITVVDSTKVSEKFLGKELTKEIAKEIAKGGADICGENGEYHTFVSAGPNFKKPVNFSFGEKYSDGDYAFLPVFSIYRSKYEACPLFCKKGDDIICDFAILVDEIASMVGLLHSLVDNKIIREELQFVCDIIYNLSPSLRKGVIVTKKELLKLEQMTMEHKENITKPPNLFVLPMGSQNATLAHILRVKSKGLVRLLCKHDYAGNKVDSLLYDFTNLLSGYFYHLAFKLNAIDGIEEVPYITRK